MLALVPIPEEVKAARLKKGWTQQKLSNECDPEAKIRQKDIALFESGKLNLSTRKIEAIAKALGKEWKLK